MMSHQKPETTIQQQNTQIPPDPLILLPDELAYIKKYVDYLLKKGKTKIPFKISRKFNKKERHLELSTIINNTSASQRLLDHSIGVVEDPKHKDKYRLGVIGRKKGYIDRFGIKHREKTYADSIKKTGVKNEYLGGGRFGDVKVIKWQDDGTIDAIKISSPGKGFQVEKLILEKLGRLKSKFDKLHDEYNNEITKEYIIQEKYEGIDMEDYLKTTGFSELTKEEKLGLALKASLSIKNLHDLGILHCDIKPENFLVNYKGEMVVTAVDFGFSKNFDIDKLPNSLLQCQGALSGTPEYMAPELLGKPTISNKYKRMGLYSQESDVFALGIMFIDQSDLNLANNNAYVKFFYDPYTDWFKSREIIFKDKPIIKTEKDLVMLDLIKRMVADNPCKRPLMREVVETIETIMNYENDKNTKDQQKIRP